MRFSPVLLFGFTALLAWGDAPGGWQGCAQDETAARLNLFKSVALTLQSGSENDQPSTLPEGLSEHLSLKESPVEKQEGVSCADCMGEGRCYRLSLSYGALLAMTQSLIAKTAAYGPEHLPAREREKILTLHQWLQDVSLAKALAAYFSG